MKDLKHSSKHVKNAPSFTPQLKKSIKTETLTKNHPPPSSSRIKDVPNLTLSKNKTEDHPKVTTSRLDPNRSQIVSKPSTRPQNSSRNAGFKRNLTKTADTLQTSSVKAKVDTRRGTTGTNKQPCADSVGGKMSITSNNSKIGRGSNY
jgi:hypothetical protein